MLLQYKNRGIIEAGCDEVGRGALAGDLYAAAVILPQDFEHNLLNDSKKLTPKQRYQLLPIIKSQAIAWSIGVATIEEIDKINILNASILAMQRAVEGLNTTPQHLLIDGNRFKPYRDIPYSCEVKGDARYLSIAAASIVAKCYRDDYMRELAKEHPQYAWDSNAGYPTKAHRNAIAEYGATPYHRTTFKLLNTQLTLF